jgi:hypothetical protein
MHYSPAWPSLPKIHIECRALHGQFMHERASLAEIAHRLSRPAPGVHNQRKKDGCYGSLASGVQACLNQVPLEIDKIHSHFTGTPRASCRGCVPGVICPAT